MAKPVTPTFRVSYPHVFEPALNKLSGKTEYSILCLFDSKADISAMKKAAMEAAAAKWGPDQKKWPKKFRSPFRKHEEKAEEQDNGSLLFPAGMEAGGVFVTMKSKERPAVVDQGLNKIIDKTDFYAGCYAVASYNVYAYEQMGNAGVSFGLGNIQKVKDGEPLGGSRSKPEDDFVAVAGAQSAAEGASADSLFS